MSRSSGAPPVSTSASAAGDGLVAFVGRRLGGGAGGAADAGVAAVMVRGAQVVAIDDAPDPARLPARRIEAPFIAPGFIDLQVNGAFGHEVGDDPAALAALATRLPATGVTAFLPTLVSRPEADYGPAFAAFDAAQARAAAGEGSGGARLVGLHLEGPLLAPARAGAHDRGVLEAATAATLDRLADATRVRLVTLAPERPGALALVSRLRARGIVVSVGHTDADYAELLAAADAGATLATHLYSAMSPFHHRAPGAVGAVLTDDRFTALLIADGVHAHAAALKLALRAKGAERLILVTDAVAAAGRPAGPATLAGRAIVSDGRAVRLPEGTLAGSTLTLDAAVRNAVQLAGVTPHEAVRMATTTPADALGLGALGRLAPGAAADLALLDEELRPLATYVAGKLAFVTDAFRDEVGDRRARS